MKLKSGVQKRSIIKIIFGGVSLMSVLGIIIVAVIWTVSETKYSRAQIKYEVEKEKELQKEILKKQVSEINSYIKYMKSLTRGRLQKNIRERTRSAHDIAANIYNQHHETLATEQIQKIIKDALRPIRFNNKRGYYFVTTLDGIAVLFTDRPKFEGTNMLGKRDADGRYVARKLIKIVKEKGEGYYEYFWTKPGSDSKLVHKKIAYVKKFAPYNWLIGTGEYLYNVELEIQQEVLKRIESVKFSKTGYVFAGTLKGVSLSGPAKGKNMIGVTDVNGVKIVQELIRAAKDDGGYVRYELPKFKGYVQHRKISYATIVPGWDWYVGAGLNEESFDALLSKKEENLRNRIRENFIKTSIILILMILTLLLIFALLSRKIGSTFMAFDTFFQNAATTRKPIEMEKIYFTEFQKIALSANQMINQLSVSERHIKENQKVMVQTEKMISLGGLAAGIAHEINNPLGAILGAVLNAERRLDPNGKKNLDVAGEIGLEMEKLQLYLQKRSIPEYIENVRTASIRAADIIKKMLGFSREGNSIKTTQHVGSLIDCALDIASNDYDLKKSYDFKSFEIIKQYQRELTLHCQETEIMQVILNIVKNAAQAMSEGGKLIRNDPQLTICTRDTEDHCIIEIIDNGPGMSKEHQEKIFEPFFTTKISGDGTGLGLSVSYFIITSNHNGSLTVESELEKGARFIIKIPKKKD